MKITIIGTGGVGGYFGGRLALAGNDVTFVARGEHYNAIAQNGLKVKSTLGEFTIKPAKVVKTLDEAVLNCDLVLVCTKAWQVAEVAQQISPFIGTDTMVLPLQNGVLAAEELANHLTTKNVVGGLCRIFSKIEGPGVISHFGADPTLVFGELDHSTSERCAWLKYTFENAGFTNIWSENIHTDLWKKFLMICSSALLAVTKTNYGQLRSIPETRDLLEEMYTEIYNVGISSGIKLPTDIVEKTMKAVDSFPPESTSSLTRDIWDGKPSELEYQNGTVVKLGKKHGVETPVNRFIYHTLLPMEQKARGLKEN